MKLAVSIFCESTRNVLQFYASHEGHAEWKSTADFLPLIIKLWNVVNVKTSHKGKHKRDYTMDPVRSSLDWKLDFLREFATFIHRWEKSGRPSGLSKETFLALRHTCLAVADCASYLVDRRGFKYVLLGHMQSDAIESRFGWLRRITCISPLLKSPPTTSPLQFHRIALHRLLNSPPLHYTADKLHRLVNLRHDEFSALQHTAAQSSVRE